MSAEENGDDVSSNNLLVALQLQKRPEILWKTQIPQKKTLKDEALRQSVLELERQLGKPLTSSQLMKKVNNMKTRIKSKVDKNKTGNKKIVLCQWEKMLHELMDGEDNPTISKIPGAKSIGPPTTKINKNNEDLSSSILLESEQTDEFRPQIASLVPPRPTKHQTKKNLETYETEETSKLTTQELQRLVLIEQLETTRVQRQYYREMMQKSNTGRSYYEPDGNENDNDVPRYAVL
ncbi:uncharacterized protein [Onthophagus taurus]|uniref:uncharacterized protein n=1 Tax=Onthophagus taurus TaxID=166361 RepID=UPI0039BDF608